MDLQALDAAFFQTSARPQRSETPDDSGRLFSAELTHALSERRREAEPRPTNPRAEERRNDHAEHSRRGDSPEPRSRRTAEISERRADRRDAGRADTAEEPVTCPPRSGPP
jgi:hypothetical protein